MFLSVILLAIVAAAAQKSSHVCCELHNLFTAHQLLRQISMKLHFAVLRKISF